MFNMICEQKMTTEKCRQWEEIMLHCIVLVEKLQI